MEQQQQSVGWLAAYLGGGFLLLFAGDGGTMWYGGAAGDVGDGAAEWAAARDRGAARDGSGGAAEWARPTAARHGEAVTVRGGVGRNFVFLLERRARQSLF